MSLIIVYPPAAPRLRPCYWMGPGNADTNCVDVSESNDEQTYQSCYERKVVVLLIFRIILRNIEIRVYIQELKDQNTQAPPY